MGLSQTPQALVPAAFTSGGMTLISTTTLSGSSVNLTSIPQTYNKLYLVVRNARPASDTQAITARLNNDSGTKYRGITAFTLDNTTAADTVMYLVSGNYDNGASDSLLTMSIDDYTNTTTRKLVQITNLYNNTTTPANLNFIFKHQIYFDNGAISQINLLPETGNWTSGTALLYGVK
jgi:hypothetical protein